MPVPLRDEPDFPRLRTIRHTVALNLRQSTGAIAPRY
jgi:hypothetical protein